ncbi:MFS transporter [Candidatus Sororendozoicomonas aggregata]|uniref:MFS transporter n=1 Tax=Candidatus Sororendozoicomonas aggregata TaxID=3073239 RepID=UPI002ED11224
MKKLLTIYTFSNLASWLDFLAVMLIISYTMNAGIYTVAMASIALVAPQFLFSNVFSKPVFTANIRMTVVVSLIVRAIITASIMFVQNPVILLLLIVPRSFLLGFFEPMFSTLISRSDFDSHKMASLTSLVNTGSKLIAPAAGAAIAASYSESIVFGLGALLCAIGGLLAVLFIRQPLNDKKEGEKTQRSQESTGQQPEKTDPFYVQVLLPASIYFFMVFSINNLFPYLLNFYGAPKEILGYCLSLAALGNAITGFILLRIKNEWETFSFATLITLLIAFLFLGISFSLNSGLWLLTMALFLVTGLFSALMTILISRRIFSSSKFATHYATSFQSMQCLAMTVAPIAGALIVSNMGEQVLLVSVSCFAVILVALSRVITIFWGKSKVHKYEH